MRTIKLIASTVLFLSLSEVVSAQIPSYDQIVIPPSPGAASLVRFVNIPVNSYTGTANVNMPLYSLPARTLSVPVGLNYHASGIKVQDVANTVGLGWSLGAGGMVTRVVRGLPDEKRIYCGESISSAVVYDIINESCDTELDVYFFSFLGRAGKFYVDPNTGEMYSSPAQDMKITKAELSGAVLTWTIIDENGYKYYFGESTSKIEYTTIEQMEYEASYTSTPDPAAYETKHTFPSTWHLSKIEGPTGDEEAIFTYTNANTKPNS
ncbi:hypothetical protein C900_00170 [Fulvivirga imtechensis AK7]|uniref:YD repeat protein n=1 Tax=Fulvivirga imtechensis AK7 TaxID=1237149 RepID=L8JMA8_9BACT|nr:hypothetical protein [Fulvivirga imtechensis]ELR68659.1 hypothetical protein C900_00170 [Fulvivirga imtechensis AK7]